MPGSWNTAWEHWYRRVLPAYWVFLFCSTHFPRLELGLDVPESDKVIHLIAFGLLAYLFWKFCESYRRPVADGLVWRAGLGLIVYAALDEWLQQFVGRSTSLLDFAADALGIMAVLAALEWRRRRSGPAARSDRTWSTGGG